MIKDKLYLLYGTERFDIEQYVIKLKKVFGKCELGINYFVLDNDNILTLAKVCEGSSFLGSDKFIVIKDTKLAMDVDILNSVVDDSTYIVIIEESVDKRTSCYKYLQKNATVKEFNILTEQQAITYVKTIMDMLKITADVGVIKHMVNTCSVNKMNLANECYKLSLYSKDKVITSNDIDTVCVKSVEAKTFEVLDKIIAKCNICETMKSIDMLVEQDEYIGILCVSLFKQFKTAYMIKLMKEQGLNDSEVIRKLGMPPYIYDKANSLCKMYGTEKIREILYKLCLNDYYGKIGLNDLVVGLKQIIVEI